MRYILQQEVEKEREREKEIYEILADNVHRTLQKISLRVAHCEENRKWRCKKGWRYIPKLLFSKIQKYIPYG